MQPATHGRPLDVVLYGATGFAGRLAAEYLAERYIDSDLTWAIAGRTQSKLEALREELAAQWTHVARLPILVADSRDRDALDAMVQQTAVVATTVGPYFKYGTELVAACVANGTHYCDLTGEPVFIRDMMDAHHEDAVKAGVRIVHCCGFDSIPSDLGTLTLQDALIERDGAPADDVHLFVAALKGGFSGGTADSMVTMMEAAADPAVRKVLIHPYALNPEDKRKGPKVKFQMGAEYDAVTGWWTYPFVMASINERVVRRSNALLDDAYGADFRYRESSKAGEGFAGRYKATMVSASMGAFMAAMAVKPTRALLQRTVLPAPGEGPSRERIDNGYFKMVVSGRRGGEEVGRAIVKGKRDPGYGATACMLSESAICLARTPLDTPGGILTPASAMGQALIARLNATDVTFSFE